MVEQLIVGGIFPLVFQVGRFHPVLLHLPIGFLLLAFVMELGWRFFGKKEFSSAIGFSLKLALIASILTVISGYNLAQEGGYETTLLTRHQYLGFGVLGLNLLLVLLFPSGHRKEEPNSFYFPLFLVLTLAVGITGHLGGSLTHGTDFLSSGFTQEEKEAQTISPQSNYYSAVIHPIFEDRCIGCHNAQKTKGGLRLDNPENISKGGDSGKILANTKGESHLLLTRVNLPLQEEEHMPPKGKPQLTESEKALLQVWLNEGGSFEQKIETYTFDASTQKHLEQWSKNRLPLNKAPELSPIAVSTLEKIKAQGIEIHPIAAGSVFLEAKFNYQNSIAIAPLQVLKKVKNHLISLKLNNTPIEDKDLKNIANFPRLRKLDLHQTNITDQSLTNIAQLENLEYLNLYQTKITDQGLRSLKKMRQLKELYLWQTKVTPTAAKSLQEQITGLKINLGRSELIFGKSQIKPPKVWSSSVLFKDTLQLTLFNPIPEGILRYTLDGSTPDSLSSIYQPPLIIDKGAQLKVICEKEGWKSSEVLQKEYLQPRHLIESIQLLNEPSPKYPGRRDSSLFDLQSAHPYTASEGWLGFQGQAVEMIVDLGEEKEVTAIAVGSFTNVLAWVFPIRSLECWTSVDGKNYSAKENLIIPEAKAGAAISIDYFKLNLQPQKARFLKVRLASQIKNPAWHAAPGEPSWIFIDEVLVW